MSCFNIFINIFSNSKHPRFLSGYFIPQNIVWKYYEVSSNKARCLACLTELSCKEGSPTNLLHHLKSKHLNFLSK